MTKRLAHSTSDERIALLSEVERFISGYMALPDPGYALVLALWAVGTWTYQVFDAFPYMVITAETKQAGKTRLLELLQRLCQNAYSMAALTPATLFRMLGEAEDEGRGITVMFDEAEALSSEAAGVMRSVLNVGYRRGQRIPRVVSNKVVQFPAYGPKVFALIGDTFETLRDRSIVVRLRRGTPARSYVWAVADAEGHGLRDRIQRLATFTGDIVDAGLMGGRESEIWTPLFSLASVWAPDRLDDLTRIAADMAAEKTAPKRHYRADAQAETETREVTYGERALTDLAGAFADSEKFMLTSDAIKRLLAIPSAPWRRYKGDGLTPILLAGLLQGFGVKPKNFRLSGSGHKGDTGKVAKGYALADVASAVKGLAK